MHSRRLTHVAETSPNTELLRRYGDQDLRVFSLAERARLRCDATPAPCIDRLLAFELLYRLEPELYDRLIAAERIHPAVLGWLPRVDSVVEVGAGSGRLTTHLLTLCARMVAVEPAGPMRELLAAKLSPNTRAKIDIVDGCFDALPIEDASADLVVTCAALDRDTAHGGDPGLLEMERVCRPGGVIAIVWPNHLDWLGARGFTYLSFPGAMWMEFRSTAEAIEMVEIFYPHAADEVRARGAARVDYDVLGVNPPRDVAYKRKPCN
jgi:SAM-dependent methyltransferase